MAVTVNIADDGIYTDGHRYKVRASIAFDNSYANGGELVSAGNFGLSLIESLTIDQTSGFVIQWDQANSKIVFHSEASNSTTGTTTSATSLAKAVAGAIDETSTADDLSALTGVQVWAYGL